jgi:hypothetical protein
MLRRIGAWLLLAVLLGFVVRAARSRPVTEREATAASALPRIELETRLDALEREIGR